jgi:hypothetical protein
MSMQFEYEISVDEYVAAVALYHKLSGRRVRLHENPIVWIAVGVFFILVAWQEKTFNWGPVLLTLLGIWWIFAGFMGLFPTKHFRRTYQEAEFWGDRFKADLDEDGFGVEADLCAWRVRWRGVKVKGEDDLVFMFYSANTVFSFGKRFLDESQQEELRRLSGMKPIGTDVS